MGHIMDAFDRKRVVARTVEEFAASFGQQEKDERSRRMTYIRQLCVELARIEEIDRHATKLGELAIEAVIVGKVDMVREWAALFAFAEEEDEHRARYVPIWETFRGILLSCHDTWPKAGTKHGS